MKNLKNFQKICGNILKKWNSSYSTKDIEATLIEALTFLKSHPENRKEFSLFLIDRIQRKEKFPLEIIIFCMRELAWPEIKKAAAYEKEKTNDWRIISAMDDILAVYEPIWIDEDLYEYYSKK